MIALVRLALRRPYTMAIAAMLILLMGGLAVIRMVVDIFPSIDIPVVYVAWNYPGLSAECPFRNFLNRVNRLDSKEVT